MFKDIKINDLFLTNKTIQQPDCFVKLETPRVNYEVARNQLNTGNPIVVAGRSAIVGFEHLLIREVFFLKRLESGLGYIGWSLSVNYPKRALDFLRIYVTGKIIMCPLPNRNIDFIAGLNSDKLILQEVSPDDLLEATRFVLQVSNPDSNLRCNW